MCLDILFAPLSLRLLFSARSLLAVGTHHATSSRVHRRSSSPVSPSWSRTSHTNQNDAVHHHAFRRRKLSLGYLSESWMIRAFRESRDESHSPERCFVNIQRRSRLAPFKRPLSTSLNNHIACCLWCYKKKQFTMTEAALTLGSALVAFGPFLTLFGIIVYQKAQLVIVVTTSAFFYLLAALAGSIFWWVFHSIGLKGPLAAVVPSIFAQFIARCLFVSLYHKVEKVIQLSLEKQHAKETSASLPASDAPILPNGTGNSNRNDSDKSWTEAAKLRLQLNDASSGIASGIGFGGMHAILLYGTLLASEAGNGKGILYQDSCPGIPSLAVSASYACMFFILDMFWMLFAFFGMRRREIFPRGAFDEDDDRRVGAWFGNSRNGGNVALLFSLGTHLVASILTTADYFNYGCYVSVPALFGVTFVTAYFFWAGIGRIYMPPVDTTFSIAQHVD